MTLTEREKEMIESALICWENEGCYNFSTTVTDDDFHRLIAKLKTDAWIYGALSIKPPAGIKIPVPVVDLDEPCGFCTHARRRHALYLGNPIGRCVGALVAGERHGCEDQCTEFQVVDP